MNCIRNEHTLQVAGGTVIYRHSLMESLYLFTLSVRVPGSKTKHRLPRIKSVALKTGQGIKLPRVMPRHSPSTVFTLRPPQQRPSRNDRRGACQRSSQVVLSRA